jgi:cyclohexyl-isocyanide hydratase
MIQLALEYDPRPPFDAGSPQGAGEALVERYREMVAPRLARVEAVLADTAEL